MPRPGFSILRTAVLRCSVIATFQLRGALTLGLGFAMAGAMAGCAGKPPSRVELPQQLPIEFQKKFEIEDPSTELAAASESLPHVLAGKRRSHRRRQHHSIARKRKSFVKLTETTVPAVHFVIPDRRPEKDPIWIGEKLTYEITYMGLPAGDFTLEVLPFKVIDGHKVYHVRGVAQSSSVFSLFYRLHDLVESFFDYQGLFSYRFHLVLDETKQSRDALELYDDQKGETFYWNRWNHRDRGYIESKEYGKIQPLSQDSISALFYVRTLTLAPNTVVSFPVVSEGKAWEAMVTVVRREMLDTPFGRIRTIVVKPETKFEGVLQKKGDSFLWLTDDERHFLVRVEAKVKIGTVVGKLKTVDSLGSPPVP